MAYLELAPAITAIRSRPEEFEFSNNTLHHLRSRHTFHFVSDDDVQIHAACDCASLRASPEQTKVFHTAYRQWYASYWRPLEINREFASHLVAVDESRPAAAARQLTPHGRAPFRAGMIRPRASFREKSPSRTPRDGPAQRRAP